MCLTKFPSPFKILQVSVSEFVSTSSHVRDHVTFLLCARAGTDFQQYPVTNKRHSVYMGGAQGNVNKDCICFLTYLKLLMSSSRPLCLAGLHAILKVVIWLFLRAYQGSTLSMDVWCQVLLPLPCQWHLDVLASKSLPVDCKYSDSGANCNLQQKTMVQQPQICPTPALLSAI